jgi:hypothetical protein
MVPLASDPNWFYSTLAQSTAALVGLAGAFMVQRLLTQRQDIGPVRARVREGALVVHDHLKGFAKALEESRDDLNEVGSKLPDYNSPGYGLGWPVELGRMTIAVLDDHLGRSGQVGLPRPPDGLEAKEELWKAIEVLDQAHSAVSSLQWPMVAEQIRERGSIHAPSPAWTERSAVMSAESGIWDQIVRQQQLATQRWSTIYDESTECGRELAVLRSRLVPRSMYLLLAILMSLLLSGVLAPLIFLSADEGPSKWILLGFFTPLAGAFVGFFAWEVFRLRRADRIENETF